MLAALHEPEPDANVVRWFARQPRQSLHLSVLTLGELRHGIEAMAETSTPDGAHSDAMTRQSWLTAAFDAAYAIWPIWPS